MKGYRVKIKECADVMGISQQFLRVLIQNNKLPFASAVKMKEDNERFSYFINAYGLAEYLGLTMQELEERINLNS